MQPIVIARIGVIAIYLMFMFLVVTNSTDAVIIVGMIHTNRCATCFAGTGVVITIHVITGRIVYLMFMLHVAADGAGAILQRVPFTDPLAAGSTFTGMEITIFGRPRFEIHLMRMGLIGCFRCGGGQRQKGDHQHRKQQAQYSFHDTFVCSSFSLHLAVY